MILSMPFDPAVHHRRSIRLSAYDYSALALIRNDLRPPAAVFIR